MLALTIQNQFIQLEEKNKQLAEATERAKYASRAKSTFLATMSHEIRTPINAIIGMTHLGEKSDKLARKDECFKKIEIASSHLLGIINDILDISKIEANKFTLSLVWFNLEELISNVVCVHAFRMEEKKINFTVDIDPNLPEEIEADDQRLSQVITNLLSNAQKFTPKGGKVELRVDLVGHNEAYDIRVTVSDNGIGTSKEQQERLFKSFEQADNSISRKHGGTGLGLAISKSIVELAGGIIGVSSVEGEGSSFYFTFPANGRNVEKTNLRETVDSDEVQSDEDCFVGRRILLAEDVDINREIFCAVMEPTGAQIFCAENGKIALEMFEANPAGFDLIMMDLQMPEMDGFSATLAIRALDTPAAKTVPIIAMTANVFKEDVEKCLESGMNDHIGKPVDYKILIKCLRGYLNKP